MSSKKTEKAIEYRKFKKGFSKRLNRILIEDTSKKKIKEKLEVSDATIYAWTHGKRAPNMLDFARLCKILKVKPGKLLYPKKKG